MNYLFMCFCFVLSGSNIRNPAHAVLIKMLSKLGFDLDFSFFYYFSVCLFVFAFVSVDVTALGITLNVICVFCSSLDTARFLFEHRENGRESANKHTKFD